MSHSEQVTHSFQLPNGAIPLFNVELLCYLDGDGQQQTLYRTGGTTTFGQLVGALEILKSLYAHMAMQGGGEK